MMRMEQVRLWGRRCRDQRSLTRVLPRSHILGKSQECRSRSTCMAFGAFGGVPIGIPTVRGVNWC